MFTRLESLGKGKRLRHLAQPGENREFHHRARTIQASDGAHSLVGSALAPGTVVATCQCVAHLQPEAIAIKITF